MAITSPFSNRKNSINSEQSFGDGEPVKAPNSMALNSMDTRGIGPGASTGSPSGIGSPIGADPRATPMPKPQFAPATGSPVSPPGTVGGYPESIVGSNNGPSLAQMTAAPPPVTAQNNFSLQSSNGRLGQNINAVTGDVSGDMLVRNQLNQVLSDNSPYVQQARARASQAANARGMMNSSMAAQSGEEAAIGAAMPIAQQDATTYFNNQRDNLAAQNQYGLADKQASLQDFMQGRELGSRYQIASEGNAAQLTAANIGANSQMNTARLSADTQRYGIDTTAQTQRDQLAQQGSQFAQSLGFQGRQLDENSRQFDSAQAFTGGQNQANRDLSNNQFGQDLTMRGRQLDQSDRQFNQSQTQQDRQYNQGLNQNDRQFTSGQTQQDRQYNQGLDLQNRQLTQSGSQFDRSLSQNDRQFTTGQNNTINENQLNRTQNNDQFNTSQTNTINERRLDRDANRTENAANRALTSSENAANRTANAAINSSGLTQGSINAVINANTAIATSTMSPEDKDRAYRNNTALASGSPYYPYQPTAGAYPPAPPPPAPVDPNKVPTPPPGTSPYEQRSAQSANKGRALAR